MLIYKLFLLDEKKAPSFFTQKIKPIDAYVWFGELGYSEPGRLRVVPFLLRGNQGFFNSVDHCGIEIELEKEEKRRHLYWFFVNNHAVR